jgi:hypothetical protein
MKVFPGIAAALLVTSIVAACAGQATKTPHDRSVSSESLPKAGDCYGDEIQEWESYSPDLTTKVDCSKKHLFEVTGVVKIPSKFLKNNPRDRESLGDNDVDRGTAFSAWMARTCSKKVLEMSGLGDLAIGGMSGVDALAEPVVASAYSEWAVNTEKQWADGHRLAFCVLHFDESEDQEGGDHDSVRSQSSTPLVKQYLDPELSPSLRNCWNYGTPETTLASCNKVHDAESILSYNVDKVLGKKFANRVDIDEFPEAQYRAIQRPCLHAVPRVVGAMDPNVIADVIYGDWQWEEGRHIATCAVGTYKGQRLPGRSIFGNARHADVISDADDKGV